MPLSKKTRREILKLGLGAGALGLIDKLGIPLLSPRKARAAGYGPGTGKPTKFLTIYVPGGWSTEYIWCSLSSADIQKFIPAQQTYGDKVWFYNQEHVTNVDLSGDALTEDGYKKLRVPRVWDEEKIKAGNYTQTFGWSWANPDWKIWENCAVVDAIQTGSAGHLAALVGTLSGISNATFVVPSIHARVAHAMAAVYGDNRPLGSVSIGPSSASDILPSAGGLPAVASPMKLKKLDGLGPLLSDKGAHWEGLHNRKENPGYTFYGDKTDKSLMSDDMEEYVLKDLRARAGSANDAFFESIYDSYRSVSTQLANDLTSVIEKSPGLYDVPPPAWTGNVSDEHKHFGLPYYYNADAATYSRLALKLLTSDLCSAVHLTFGNAYHDDHGSLDHKEHCHNMRQIHEQVGRLIAFMKMLPGVEPGNTLLDETLVMVCSEFNRAWPKSGTCGHWPIDSVCFAGGNVKGNRMLGGFDTKDVPENTYGFDGVPVDMWDESNELMSRPLQRRDIAYSALNLLGVPNSFLPGGPGRIIGLGDYEG